MLLFFRGRADNVKYNAGNFLLECECSEFWLLTPQLNAGEKLKNNTGLLMSIPGYCCKRS